MCAGLYPNVAVAPPSSLCPAPGGGGGGGTSPSVNGAPKGAGGGGNGKGKGEGKGKTAGEVSFRGRKGAMYLHPMTVNFESKELGSRYGVYHEVVKTSKVQLVGLLGNSFRGCLGRVEGGMCVGVGVGVVPVLCY